MFSLHTQGHNRILWKYSKWEGLTSPALEHCACLNVCLCGEDTGSLERMGLHEDKARSSKG